MGAGKWHPEYTDQLREAGAVQVVVLRDNGWAGVAHAETVAQSCHAAGLAVRLAALPGLPPVQEKQFVLEPELAVTLKVIARETNTLSGIIRQAWDSGNLATLTKNSPLRATGAHVSIVGHVTEEEVRRYLTETERANGFANRFLWFLVKRSKMLPEADPVPEAAVYPQLSDGKLGLVGAIVNRAEAHVLRLSTLYAVLDRSRAVRLDHLTAALALWDYAEASARYLQQLGAPRARRRGTRGVS